MEHADDLEAELLGLSLGLKVLARIDRVELGRRSDVLGREAHRDMSVSVTGEQPAGLLGESAQAVTEDLRVDLGG